MPTHQQVTSSGVFVGCSGWQYRHWRGSFYPDALPAARWLDYYSARFDTVEINHTFYRLPEARTFAAWGRSAPRGFLYAVKASRYLTHMKKLKEPREAIARLFVRAKRLGASFGPVLYQLPPGWAVNAERLDAFLRALPRARCHAVEFRDATWYTDEVCALLERRRVALCLHDMKGSATGMRAVGPFVYVRFHGVQKYSGRYDDATLERWAEWLAAERQRGRPVFAYFNNDTGGHAPRDAVRLRTMIARSTSD